MRAAKIPVASGSHPLPGEMQTHRSTGKRAFVCIVSNATHDESAALDRRGQTDRAPR